MTDESRDDIQSYLVTAMQGNTTQVNFPVKEKVHNAEYVSAVLNSTQPHRSTGENLRPHTRHYGIL